MAFVIEKTATKYAISLSVAASPSAIGTNNPITDKDATASMK
jgi:hypothetical protein